MYLSRNKAVIGWGCHVIKWLSKYPMTSSLEPIRWQVQLSHNSLLSLQFPFGLLRQLECDFLRPSTNGITNIFLRSEWASKWCETLSKLDHVALQPDSKFALFVSHYRFIIRFDNGRICSSFHRFSICWPDAKTGPRYPSNSAFKIPILFVISDQIGTAITANNFDSIELVIG